MSLLSNKEAGKKCTLSRYWGLIISIREGFGCRNSRFGKLDLYWISRSISVTIAAYYHRQVVTSLWGHIMEKAGVLKWCISDFYQVLSPDSASWITFGNLTSEQQFICKIEIRSQLLNHNFPTPKWYENKEFFHKFWLKVFSFKNMPWIIVILLSINIQMFRWRIVKTSYGMLLHNVYAFYGLLSVDAFYGLFSKTLNIQNSAMNISGGL